MKKLYPARRFFVMICTALSYFAFTLHAQTVSLPFILDTKAPEVTLNGPNSGNYSIGQTITVTWSATDDNIAVNGVTIGLWDVDLQHLFVLKDNLSNDGTEQVQLTVPSGNARIKVVVRDDFGNPGSDTSDQIITVTGGYLLNGYVLEYGNNNPIHFATVTAAYQRFEYTAQTDADGYFEIVNLPAGNYAITAFMEGYESQTSYKTITGNTTLNFHLHPSGGGANQVAINNKLTIYADNIQTITANDYQLSGNVNINGILYFDGTITLDKRPYLVYPEITGNCSYSAHGIQGNNETLKSGNDPFHFYCQDEFLYAKGYDYMNYLTLTVGGFTVKSGCLEVDPDGQYVTSFFIVQMPYPINMIINYLQDKEDLPSLLSEIGGSIIYNKTSGIGIAADIEGISCKFGLFDIKDLHLYFNTVEQIYGGGLTLKIPGSLDRNNNDNDNDSLFNKPIPIKVINESGDTAHYNNLEDFVYMQRAFGADFLEFGFDIEFVQGGINSLMLHFSTKIPIDATGLFITEISGGVTDLQTNDWRIHGSIDISAGLELPVVGEPLMIDDLGFETHPVDYFKGSGTVKVFGWDAAGGYLEYIPPKSALNIETHINIFNILRGKTYFNLRHKDFTGEGTCSLTTPDLPMPFRFLSNLNIGFAEVFFSNYEIRSLIDVLHVSLAQKMEFGNQYFPYFHYYVGRNYDHPHKVWKGRSLDGKDMTDFLVYQNTPQLLVVTEGTTGTIDFYLQDPNGVVYDSTKCHYARFPDVNETVMTVEQPLEGTWTFITADTMQYEMEAMCQNQDPAMLVDNPSGRKSRSNQITMDFNDYADTLDVKVYYDTDPKNFDGTFIQDFQVVNNASLQFDWQNDTIPDGEYFIYAIADDGYNTPVAQYAPGSIIIQNDTLTETPQNIQLDQSGDSLKVSWDAPVEPYTCATEVNYRKPTDRLSGQKVVTDSAGCYITGLEMGKKYEVWCRFLNLNLNGGPESDTVSIVLNSGLRNNPPYFEMYPDSTWIFIEGTTSEYALSASDADGDALTYGIVEDTLGMTLDGDNVSWTPTAGQTGVFDIQFTVTDGSAYDTVHQYMIVYNEQQMRIALSFSSVNLYESDNMFIKVKNYHQTGNEVNITLTNLTTSGQTEVSCRKVNDFDFIGQFKLSFPGRSELPVNNGDTIEASYSYGDSLYTAKACYDSLPQPSDVTPPAQINDLAVVNLGHNTIELVWTATGNDQYTGKAYRYDIRYHFDTIATEDDYLVSHRYPLFHPPRTAGERDSVIVDLALIDSSYLFNKVWWAIVAEDEMYNRSTPGTTPGYSYHLMPYDLQTEVLHVNTVRLQWEGPLPDVSRDTIVFQGYDVYRKINGEPFVIVASLLDTTILVNTLFDNENALYTYGVQAVYSDDERSDTLFSDPVELGLYTTLNVFVDCMDSIGNGGALFTMTSLDSIYPETYRRATGESGLLLFANIVKGDYRVNITKDYYAAIIDTVTVSVLNNRLVYELYPNVDLSGDSLLVIAPVDTLFDRSFTIHNYSGSDIEYSAVVNVEDTSRVRSDSLYTRMDSDQPGGPVFVWYDISGIGTQTSLSGDESYIEVNLPFTFNFYENPKTLVKISTDGYLTFGSSGTDWTNDPIPSINAPNDLIAPFWDDLEDWGGHVYTFFDEANSRFIVQYDNWGYYNNSGYSNLQIQLYEDGSIKYYYLSMTGTLNSATVGIENGDGTEGLQIAYNEPYIHDSLAVAISPVSSWIRLLSTTGTIAPDDDDTVRVQFDTHDLSAGDDYHADIALSFEEDVSPSLTIPVLLRTIAQQDLNIPAGWSGISGYIDPSDRDVTHIFAGVEDQLVILMSMYQIYWPLQEINTIGNWDYLSGYKIKVENDVEVILTGLAAPGHSLLLNTGWNLMPVLSAIPVNTEQLFSPLGDTLVIVKEIGGIGVYWPSQGINTLPQIYPGKAYYLNVTHYCGITFPDDQRYDTTLHVQEGAFPLVDIWNPVEPTQSSHIIGIDRTALSRLRQGDDIGVFNEAGLCCGIVRVYDTGKPVGFPVFADDISTDRPDGFQTGESMAFRLYRPGTGKQFDLTPVFDLRQPDAGDFVVNGLSYILDFDAEWEIPDVAPGDLKVEVYPVPAKNELIIDIKGFAGEDYNLRIYNSSGELVLHRQIKDELTKLDISSLASGIYALYIEADHSRYMKKFVVR